LLRRQIGVLFKEFVMARIIAFPRPASATEAPAAPVAAQPRRRSLALRSLSRIIFVLWCVLAIAWPLVRLVLIIDILFQGFRVLISFADKGLYVDWAFIGHYAFAMFLVCFIHGYRS
jgi:hypothetical protein